MDPEVLIDECKDCGKHADTDYENRCKSCELVMCECLEKFPRSEMTTYKGVLLCKNCFDWIRKENKFKAACDLISILDEVKTELQEDEQIAKRLDKKTLEYIIQISGESGMDLLLLRQRIFTLISIKESEII